MDETKPQAFAFEPEAFEQLRYILKKLYGDGRHFDPDERRDLANLMAVVLDKAIEIDDLSDSLNSIKRW